MSKMQILHEAMTAEEISAAQNEHYMLDDNIRRSIGRLTADQKRKVLDAIRTMAPSAAS